MHMGESTDLSLLRFELTAIFTSTPWEIHHHNRTEIAGKVGLFAMGSLSSMIKKNPKISLAGSVPHLGSRLTVDSPAFAAILICLVTTHLTVFTLTYMLARPRA